MLSVTKRAKQSGQRNWKLQDDCGRIFNDKPRIINVADLRTTRC